MASVIDRVVLLAGGVGGARMAEGLARADRLAQEMLVFATTVAPATKGWS